MKGDKSVWGMVYRMSASSICNCWIPYFQEGIDSGERHSGMKKIQEGRKKGRKKGRKEVRKEGRKEQLPEKGTKFRNEEDSERKEGKEGRQAATEGRNRPVHRCNAYWNKRDLQVKDGDVRGQGKRARSKLEKGCTCLCMYMYVCLDDGKKGARESDTHVWREKIIHIYVYVLLHANLYLYILNIYL
jgi:hypothetical protein